MDEFIQMAVSELGFSKASAQMATVDLLRMIVDRLEQREAEELLQEFPEIRGMLDQAEGKGVVAMLRRLQRAVGLEEDLNQIMYRVDRGAESLGPFIHLFVDVLKANVVNNLAARILAQYQALDESLY